MHPAPLLVPLIGLLGTLAPAQRLVHTVSSPQSGHLGSSVASLGDLDGDGRAEFAVGAPGLDEVLVIDGRTFLVRFRVTGASAGEEFGAAVAGAGDVNADGVRDLVVGAPRSTVAGVDSGRAVIVSGVDGAPLFPIDGPTADDRFGAAVDGAGDVDGDGYDDVIVGAPGEFGTGTAHVHGGRDGRLLYVLRGEAIGDAFGSAVCGLGDIDSDGFADVAVGAPGSDGAGPGAGRAYIYSGRRGVQLWVIDGPTAADRFGAAVAAGDIDRDGRPDLVVGAPGEFGTGTAHLLRAATGATIRVLRGVDLDDAFGAAVAVPGDVDGDGFDDVLVGAPGDDDAGADSGSATLFSGRDGSPLGFVTGAVAGARAGRAVAGAGDIDDDGYPELLTGAPADARFAPAGGTAAVHDLDRSGTPPRVAFFGRGCAGTAGRVLRIDAIGRPFLGATMQVRMRGGQPLRPALYTLGRRENLPLDAFGYPGCSAYALNDAQVFVTFTTGVGTAGYPLTLPSLPVLLGLRVATQWVADDPAANAGGATTSDALELTLGG